ncbi:hypothetical protein [Stackebrandtia albiflava]|nr:hypothetical protein [Stackebrandtia albiflava]
MSTRLTRRLVAVVAVAAFSVCVTANLVALGHRAPVPIALWSMVVGVLAVVAWLLLARHVPPGQVQRRWWPRRRRAVRFVYYLGLTAWLSIGLNTSLHLPGWSEFASAGPVAVPVEVVEIGDVDVHGGRRTTYEFLMTAVVPDGSDRRTVTQTVELAYDPRGVAPEDHRLFAYQVAGRPELGVFFTDSPEQHSWLTDWPIAWTGAFAMGFFLWLFWWYEEWDARKDGDGGTEVRRLGPPSPRLLLISGGLVGLSMLLLLGLAGVSAEHQGPPGFNNEVWDQGTAISIVVGPVFCSPAFVAGWLTRCWAETGRRF